MKFATKQFKHEFRNLIGRWKQESDLEDDELILAAVEALNAFRCEGEEDGDITFEADPNIFDDIGDQESGDDI